MNNKTEENFKYALHMSKYWRASYSVVYSIFKRINIALKWIEGELKKCNRTDIRILDIGCGRGDFIFLLREKLKDQYRIIFHGIDLSAELINVANKRKELAKAVECEFLIGDAEKIKFDAKSYDIIVCLETIEHLSGYAKFISNLNMSLKDNGVFIISTPNKTSPLVKTERSLRQLKKGHKSTGDLFRSQPTISAGHGHISEKSISEWVEVFKRSGFRIEKIKGGSLFWGGGFYDKHPLFFGCLLVCEAILDRLPFGYYFSWDFCIKMRKNI